MNDCIDRIAAARVVPVVRAGTTAAAWAKVQSLRSAGFDVVELTTTTPDWQRLLQRVRDELPGACVGLGTVTTAEQARGAVAAGAAFCVSPCQSPEVRRVCDADGVVFVEGGFTPTEVLASAAHGIAKLFPAHLGGPRYLRSLLAVVPGARIIPTGGIALGDVDEWIAAGAFAVGVGSALPS